MSRSRVKRHASALSDHAKVRGVRKGRGNVRRGERRQAWLRGARRLGLGLTAAVALGAIVYGGVKLTAWAKTTPRFAVDTIEVVGAVRAQPETLRRLLGVAEGDNLIVADSDEMHDRVAAHPWVAAVEIDKRYPRRLVVTVTEHEPVALVALGHLYYADREGEIVKRYAPGELAPFPVITGLSREAVESDAPQARALLAQALDFLRAWGALQGEDAPEVAEVNVDPVMGLSFVLAQDAARVIVGKGPWAPKIERWVTVRQTLAARGVGASRITLSGTRRPDRVVARLRSRAGVETRGGDPRRADKGRTSRTGGSAEMAAGPRRTAEGGR